MSTESINNWKNKNLRQEYNHGYDREEKKTTENGKRIVDNLYLVYEDPTQ